MRFVSSQFKQSAAKVDRRSAVRSMLLIFGAVMICVSAMVFSALDRVAHYANQLDEDRSREAVTGAVRTFRDQLGATLHDYAAWDDAVQFAYIQPDLDWLKRNFGDMSFNSELFDAAFILDQDGKVLTAHANGLDMSAHIDAYLTPDVLMLFDRVRTLSQADFPEVTGFASTQSGIAAVGVGLIRMKSGERGGPLAQSRYVVFLRHLTEETVKRLSQAYVLPGLSLEHNGLQSSHRVALFNSSGDQLAALSWVPRYPGDASLAQVRPLVWCAVLMIAIYMLLLFVSGSQALKRMSADESAAVKLSLTDRLSGLANRAGLFIGLQQLVAYAQEQGHDVALLYLDLDGFKEVNDAYGHATGDLLIRCVSAGLKVLCGEEMVLARVGGDEFAIAFSGFDVHRKAAELSERILEFLSEPLVIGERVAVIGCSIGLSVSRKGLVASEELIRRADMAMYRSKEDGRGRWTLYDPSMDDEREMRNQLELDLRVAIERQQIAVVYQPVVRSSNGRIAGVEALARWSRDGYGPVSPDVFIPIAESTGLIDLLGMCVLRSACFALRQWPELTLSVNVSPGQFRDPAFVGRVEEILQEAEIDAQRLTLEMTETYFIQNPARARQTLEMLRGMGIRVALDDFGAGFSSVGYLRQFGFDRVKIDKSLVQDITESQRSAELLHATVALARSLDMPVTAEGVETGEQADALRLAGCELLQGYLFGKPSPADEITRMLHQTYDDHRPMRAAE